MVVGHSDLPAVVRPPPGDREVAAKADQDADAEAGCELSRAAVSGPGFGGGAEVERGPAGELYLARWAVKEYVTPAGDGTGLAGGGRLALGELGEVAVVAGGGQRAGHRGVDLPVGQLRRPQRLRD